MAELTGRMNVTFRTLRVLVADMLKNGTPEEMVTAQLLQCVEAAVKADEGDELLALVQQWMQGKVDDMTQELKGMVIFDDLTYADLEE